MINIHELPEEEVLKLRLQTTHFNIHYNDQKKYRKIVDELCLIVPVLHCRKEVLCIVTNVARALGSKAKSLSIPKMKKCYTNNAQKISWSKMCAVLDYLSENGYLVGYRGGFLRDMSSKILSIYVFTDKLTNMFKGVDTSKEIDYHPLVVIKDRATGEIKSSRGVAGCGEITKKLQKYNNVLKTAKITFNGVDLPYQIYFRSFSDNTITCGRFYNTVGGIQTMSQKQRSELKINGEDVVELDFKAMHPSILYEWKWQDEPERVEKWIDFMFNGDYDPYKVTVGSKLLEVDESLVLEYKIKHDLRKYDPLRNLIKYCVMVSLNASNHMAACRALTDEFYSEVKKWGKEDTGEFKYYGIINPKDFNNVKTFPASFFCTACMNANRPIQEYFYQDKGVDLQFTDSEIMFRVLNSLAEIGEPAFSEHDSVIVRKSIKAQAKQLLRDAYFSVVGSDKFCIIEEK